MASGAPPTPSGTTPRASYSTAAVARRLGVSVPTVQRWVDLGHLKAWKTVGGHRRIDAASADAFLGSREAQVLVTSAQADTEAPISVLVVDDNPDDRDLLTALVQAALPSARVSTANSGFAGLLSIGRQPPDVLITDLVMPHMNGLEMLRELAQLKQRRPRVILAVSSSTPAQRAALGPLPEEVHFVPKPLEPEAFVAALTAAARAADLRIPAP